MCRTCGEPPERSVARATRITSRILPNTDHPEKIKTSYIPCKLQAVNWDLHLSPSTCFAMPFLSKPCHRCSLPSTSRCSQRMASRMTSLLAAVLKTDCKSFSGDWRLSAVLSLIASGAASAKSKAIRAHLLQYNLHTLRLQIYLSQRPHSSSFESCDHHNIYSSNFKLLQSQACVRACIGEKTNLSQHSNDFLPFHQTFPLQFAHWKAQYLQVSHPLQLCLADLQNVSDETCDAALHLRHATSSDLLPLASEPAEAVSSKPHAADLQSTMLWD